MLNVNAWRPNRCPRNGCLSPKWMPEDADADAREAEIPTPQPKNP